MPALKDPLPVPEATRVRAGPRLRYASYALLALVMTLTIARFVVPARDWEMLTTKHYFDPGTFYYGGYLQNYVRAGASLRAIQSEAQSNYLNLRPLTERASPRQATQHVTGFPGTERLLVPFLLSFLLRVNLVGLNVWSLFLVLNLVLWLLAVLFAFRLARRHFQDPYSPWCAAMLTAVSPVFTVTFHAVKVQPIGTVLLLGGALLYETRIAKQSRAMQFLSLGALFFLGLFASGGWLFLLSFLVVWQLTGVRTGRASGIAVAVAACAVARLWLTSLSGLYGLPSVERTMSFSYGAVLVQSGDWLRALLAGEDVGGRFFLNYRGFTLVSEFVPLIVRSFVGTYWPLLPIACVAALRDARARAVLAAAVVLFLCGHAGMMTSGWLFHYGYLSAPAGLMVTLAAARGFAILGSDGRRWLRGVAAGLLVVALGWFLVAEKAQVSFYYGGNDLYLKRVYACHGEERPCVGY